MDFAQRILAHRQVVAALLDDVEQVMTDLDVEFFTANNMVVITIDDQSTVDQVIDALDRKYDFKIESPAVQRRASFALVGKKITIQRVGSVLRVYATR